MAWIDIFANAKYDFMGKRRIFYVIYILLITFSIFVIFLKGINFGIDFTGGNLVQISTKNSDISKIRNALSQLNLKDISVQNFGQEKDYIIRYSSEVDAQVVVNKLKEILNDEIILQRAEKVGPTIGSELRKQAFILSIIAIGLILIYIWIRFDFYFGFGTILALIIDLIMVLGLYSLFQLEFSTITVAAILTIIGYDVNDSVIIADRIREILKENKGHSAYKIRYRDKLLEIHFLLDGDKIYYPIAIASIIGKYLRELFMKVLNERFGFDDEIPFSSGYKHDIKTIQLIEKIKLNYNINDFLRIK